MARIARVVVPESPHHITQRGNRGQKVFFNENDYSYYLRLLKTYSDRFKVDIICYCLMSIHMQLTNTFHQGHYEENLPCHKYPRHFSIKLMNLV